MAAVDSSDHSIDPRSTIVWLDSGVNNEENITAQQKLCHEFGDVEPCEEGHLCQALIQMKQDRLISLIVSGRLSREIIPNIHQLEQVVNIYIYCMDKSRHEEWAKNYSKIKGVIVKLEQLILQIRTDLQDLSKKKESAIKPGSIPKPISNSNAGTAHIPQASTVKKTPCALDGYEKVPLCSLEEAVAPLVSIVADVVQMVWIVKQNSQNPADGLTSDESASIALYTMEWFPMESSFFYFLNNAIRSENNQQLKPWFHYLKLVFQAWSKLKTASNIVYQGINTDVSKDYPKDKIFVRWEFFTCTSSLKALENDEGFNKTGERTLFSIDCRSGKDISSHAFDQSKEQVLFLPGCQFQVIACLNSGNDFNIIQWKEMQSPYSFT